MEEWLDQSLDSFQEKINYRFEKRALLVRAFTHSSYASEHDGYSDNERLEFLGDSVLGAVVAQALFENYVDSPEGELARLKAFAVSETELARIAREIDLGSYLLLGQGEEIDGREKNSILADALEAVVCAIYLDSNSLEPIRETFLSRIMPRVELLHSGEIINDYKTALQEFTQGKFQDRPEYVHKSTEGPPHARVFTIEARLGGEPMGTGTGPTKKNAEQHAAAEAWFKLTGAKPLIVLFISFFLLTMTSEAQNDSSQVARQAPRTSGWLTIDNSIPDPDPEPIVTDVDEELLMEEELLQEAKPQSDSPELSQDIIRKLNSIETLYYSGKYEEAHYYSEKFLRGAEDKDFKAALLYYAGRSMRMLNRGNDAEKYFKRIVSEMPDTIYARRARIEIFSIEGEKTSVQDDERTIPSESEIFILHESGDYALKAGRLDEAFMSFKKAMTLDPQYAITWYKLGNTCIKAHNSGRSNTAKDYTELAEWYYRGCISKNGPGSAKINLGVLLYEKGYYSSARKQWLDLINRGPDTPFYDTAREYYRLSLRRETGMFNRDLPYMD